MRARDSMRVSAASKRRISFTPSSAIQLRPPAGSTCIDSTSLSVLRPCVPPGAGSGRMRTSDSRPSLPSVSRVHQPLSPTSWKRSGPILATAEKPPNQLCGLTRCQPRTKRIMPVRPAATSSGRAAALSIRTSRQRRCSPPGTGPMARKIRMARSRRRIAGAIGPERTPAQPSKAERQPTAMFRIGSNRIGQKGIIDSPAHPRAEDEAGERR